MYPPADDNYGEESCSIAALGGRDIPPVVIIATSSAILYHCLLLPEQNTSDEDLNLVFIIFIVSELHTSYPFSNCLVPWNY